MKTFFDCVPCFIQQTLDAARMATEDKTVQEEILRSVLEETAHLSFSETPPHMARRIHRIIRECSGCSDPYAAVKRHFNELALGELEELRSRVEDSPNPFETAVRLAIAGNIIDFGVASWDSESPLWDTIEEVLERPFDINDLPRFHAAVEEADEILYLGDNTGEIVLDQLLIEQLPTERVVYAVKGAPIINDATLQDARETGMVDLVEVVENGSDAPGTILDLCNESFRELFWQSDLVISKGQANYETLSKNGKAGLFFLLKVKCPVVARDLNCEIGSIIVRETENGNGA
ncbi:MAG: damage-control phosphatase ARMT1 family protein [Candidatus Brocadiia bacterium]